MSNLEKNPVPLIAKEWGFFYRLHKMKNPGGIRLLSRNQDPHSLETFITATTSRWRCFVNESTPLRCSECSLKQQRECAGWALAKAHSYWRRFYRLRDQYFSFLDHPLVKASRDQLIIIYLRLQRIYRIPSSEIVLESYTSRRRLTRLRGNSNGSGNQYEKPAKEISKE